MGALVGSATCVGMPVGVGAGALAVQAVTMAAARVAVRAVVVNGCMGMLSALASGRFTNRPYGFGLQCLAS